MVEALSKAVFSTLANSVILRKLASRYGMRHPRSFARRFVAGERLDEAIAAARQLEQAGLTITLDHLGEKVTSREAATSATREYIDIVQATAQAGISRNLSLKLTQLGLDIDRATAIDNLRRVLDAAERNGFFVRIDMEGSAYSAATFDIFETVWGLGSRNVGTVIQAYLRRSPQDVDRMNALGARVRLVKGAYREPKDVALPQKHQVDAAFVELMQALLKAGHYPAIATHDPAMIDATRRCAAGLGLKSEAFEFQMLYGVRRDLQLALVKDGYAFRVYVPFGTDWFPYFMRRLGERPANVAFVFRNVARERA
jgi:proline dehydrogenase